MSIQTCLTYIRCDWRGCHQCLESETDSPPTEQDIETYLEENDWEHVDAVTDYCDGCKELYQRVLAQDRHVDEQIDTIKESA